MANTTETRKVKIITDAQQSTASLNQMRSGVTLLRKEFNKLEQSHPNYKKQKAELQKLSGAYAKARKDVNGFASANKRFWTNAKTMMAGVVGGNLLTGILTGLQQFAQSGISYAAKLSDSFAGVRKTTGLTAAEVDKLSESLSQLNTRTSKGALLEIAKQAGKLGITGVRNVREFVSAFDKINVALGEDLGNEGIEAIAKMNDVFGETKKMGIEKSMMATASAINSLGQSGTAKEGYIVEFTKRLAGVANQSDIAIPNILGLGATLDELGLTSEVSSTSLTKLFVAMQKDSKTYANIAGIEVSKFNKILKEDANAAFIEFLKGLNNNSDGLKGLAQNFDKLGIDGTRAISVVAALSQNTDKLSQKQKLANQEFKAGNSVLKEFNVNNETFAAKLEKGTKFLKGMLLNNPLSKGLKNFVANLADLAEKQEDFAGELERTIPIMNSEFNALKDTEMPLESRQIILEKINKEYGSYMPNLLSETSSLYEIEKAQNAVNKAMLKRVMLMRFEKMREEAMSKEASGYAMQAKAALNKEQIIKGLGEYANFTPKQRKEALKTFGEGQEELGKGFVDVAKKELDEVNKLIRQMGKISGIDDLVDDNKKNTGRSSLTDDQNKAAEKRKKEREKNAKEDIKAEDAKFRELVELNTLFFLQKEAILKKNLLADRITKDEYDHAVILNEIAMEESLLKIAEERGKDTIKIEDKILDLKLRLKAQYVADATALEKEQTKIEDEEAKARLKAAERQAALEHDLQMQTAAKWKDVQNELFSSSFNTAEAYLAKEQRLRIKAIDDAYNIEVVGKNLTESEKEKIENEYNFRRREELRKQAIETRALATFEIAVNIARGITAALATGPTGVPLAIAMGVLGGVQAAAVAAQPMPEFYKGGKTLVQGESGKQYLATNTGSFSEGGRYSTPSYGIIGEKGSELVVPNWLYSSPDWSNTMSSIERAIGVGEYAEGGVTPGNTSSSNEMSQLMAMNAAILSQLSEQLKNP